MKQRKTGAVTVRLDQELKARLANAAAKLDLSENDIVRHAIRAAVHAIEANDYKIELPLELALKKTPAISQVERGALAAIRRHPATAGLNEPEGQYKTKDKTRRNRQSGIGPAK